jgi:hypothetical protein
MTPTSHCFGKLRVGLLAQKAASKWDPGPNRPALLFHFDVQVDHHLLA